MLTESTRSKDFPALAGRTYLNTAAESVPPLCVGEAIQSYWQDKLSGMDGRQGHFAAVEACREVSARMIGLSPDEVSFCSCSSEAYNLFASALDLGQGDEVVVSDLDFPAGPPLGCAVPVPGLPGSGFGPPSMEFPISRTSYPFSGKTPAWCKSP